MGWKRALGISALVGARRDLDELLAEKEECEQMIRHKGLSLGEWKECEEELPKINRQIAIAQAKVDAED
ncbi:MAG: hypothetical protein KJI69_03495 [Patescibacteria group bacterium]|nr:hypothetical protein [Patescibacteria group bacterium]